MSDHPFRRGGDFVINSYMDPMVYLLELIRASQLRIQFTDRKQFQISQSFLLLAPYAYRGTGRYINTGNAPLPSTPWVVWKSWLQTDWSSRQIGIPMLIIRFDASIFCCDRSSISQGNGQRSFVVVRVRYK